MLVLCIFSENHNKDMWDIKSIVRYNGQKIDFIESQAVNNGLLRPANYQGIWICLISDGKNLRGGEKQGLENLLCQYSFPLCIYVQK